MAYDEEKAPVVDNPLSDEKGLHDTAVPVSSDRGSSPTTELYNNTPVTQDNGLLSKLRRLEARMDQKLSIESEAIDRKRAEDKKYVPWHEQLTMALLWASGTMNTSCFATGFLGWLFGLSLKQAILITIFASILGGAVTGYCATFGAATGLRQISVSRYSFGWWPNKLVCLSPDFRSYSISRQVGSAIRRGSLGNESPQLPRFACHVHFSKCN